MSRELVGRHEELSRVERFLDAAKGGTPRPPDSRRGRGRQDLRLVTRPGTARPPAAHAVRPAGGRRDRLRLRSARYMLRDEREAVSALPTRQRHALEVALRLAERTDSPDQASVGLAVHGVLTQLAEEKPLVVAVDDVQWLDTPSAVVLGFAVRRLRSGPIALLVAWRTDDGAAPAPLELDRSGLADTMERLALPALSFGAVQRLLQRRLDIVPPRPVLRRLYELSAGNPFFALELGCALRGGTLELEPGERLPVPLEGVVGTRLEPVSTDAANAGRCRRDRAADGRARRRPSRAPTLERSTRSSGPSDRCKGGPDPLLAPASGIGVVRGGNPVRPTRASYARGKDRPRHRGTGPPPGLCGDGARRSRRRRARVRGEQGRSPRCAAGGCRALRARRAAHP